MIANTARFVRTGLVATAGAAALAGGLAAAAPAQAATQAPAGYVTQIQCTGESGHVSYSPGLRTAAHAENAVLSATLTGCSDAYGGVFSDNGQLSATLSGSSTKASGNLSGSFVINWPASSHYNPSVGTATLNIATNTLTLGGYTSSTTGAWEGSYVHAGMLVTAHKGAGTKAHPITQQTFVNTVPLTVQHNLG
jgi:hypothetical protein